MAIPRIVGEVREMGVGRTARTGHAQQFADGLHLEATEVAQLHDAAEALGLLRELGQRPAESLPLKQP